MRARSVVVCLLLAPATMLLPGCAASVAPKGWLPYAQEAQQEAYGGWLDMVVADGGGSQHVTGELLAISDDSVYTLRATTLFVSALATVQRATLETYDPRSGDVADMAIGGTLLTVTHGVLLILTAPLWIIVGTASSAALSYAGKQHVDTPKPGGLAADTSAVHSQRASWRDLRLYARFPQGLPAGLDRMHLHERPKSIRARPVRSDPRSITGG